MLPMRQLGEAFDVLAFGRFPRDHFRVEYADVARPTTDTIEQAIALEWDRRKAEADLSGRLLFNGDLFRYLDHKIIAAIVAPGGPHAGTGAVGLNLYVGPTCYRDFVGTNLYNHHRLAEFGWERFSNPIGTTATIATVDGRIIYGRRSDRVAYHPGHVHTFGGALEPADRMADGRIDAFDSVMRELHEELALKPQEIRDLFAVGIVRDTEIRQPELLFEARVTLTSRELIERWPSAESADEHESLVSMEDAPGAIAPFIRENQPIAPVAVGGLLLWGRSRWGEDWYEESRRASFF